MSLALDPLQKNIQTIYFFVPTRHTSLKFELKHCNWTNDFFVFVWETSSVFKHTDSENL